MAGKAEAIYHRLPVALQHFATTAKGWQLDRLRRRGIYRRVVAEIAARQGWSLEQHRAYQLRALQAVVSHAASTVPHYRETLTHDGATPTLETLDDLRSLPLLDREALRESPGRFVSDVRHPSRTVHTTGTTGSPLRVGSDDAARQANYAFFDSYLKSLQLDPKRRHVIIGGRIIVHPSQSAPPFWRHSRAQRSLLMSSYHLSPHRLEGYVEAIRRFDPQYIDSYPSSAYTLAKHILESGRRLSVEGFVTSAESLYPDQREVIEEAFGCTVSDQYGCAEMAVFVGQCRAGRYHQWPDYSILELVDDDGEPVPRGVAGRVVCTGFINYAMPLVRYPIGDLAVWAETDDCTCGLHTPVLAKVLGRQDDVLILADGRRVGRLSPVLKGLPVVEAQYVQRERGHVLVQVVPADDFDSSSDLGRIEKALRMRVGDDTGVEIALVDRIERGRGGKLRAVISHVREGISPSMDHNAS